MSKLVPLLRRAIPSDALTALLAIFSALFKYIMIPSDSFDVIQRIWVSFRETLSKSSLEVRRATAEVWGVLVRKLKLQTRVRLVTLLVSDLDGVEDIVPWVIVDACKVSLALLRTWTECSASNKSVAQSVHTAAPSIISQMLRCYVDAQTAADELYHVIRRILTALIHNVGNAEQFSPITAVVLDAFKLTIPSNIESTIKLLPVVVTISSVRHGSRLTRMSSSKVISTPGH